MKTLWNWLKSLVNFGGKESLDPPKMVQGFEPLMPDKWPSGSPPPPRGCIPELGMGFGPGLHPDVVKAVIPGPYKDIDPVHWEKCVGSPYSQRRQEWDRFAYDVSYHIDWYTVPQYGDAGEDEIDDYSIDFCLQTARNYLRRIGKSERHGEEQLDLMKAAHFIQIAWRKYGEKAKNSTGCEENIET